MTVCGKHVSSRAVVGVASVVIWSRNKYNNIVTDFTSVCSTFR